MNFKIRIVKCQSRLLERCIPQPQIVVIILAVLLNIVSAGCLGIRPGQDEPVISRIMPTFKMEVPSVVMIGIDGCRADIFYEMMAEGELPNFKRYFADKGVVVENATDCLTSTTYANFAALLTGKYPAHLNLPGNQTFERDNLIRRKYNTAKGVLKLRKDIKGKTIFEILDGDFTAAVSDQVSRGASYFNSHRNWLGIGYFLQRWKKVDRIAIETFHDILEISEKRGKFPLFSFVHLVAADTNGHLYGPASTEYRDRLRYHDKHIGRLIRTFEEIGILDKLIIVLVSDHGMVQILNDNHLSISDFFNNTLRVKATSAVIDEKYSLPERIEILKDYRVLEAMSGDRYCFLYFRNPKSNPQKDIFWRCTPLSSLRHFKLSDGTEVDLIAILRQLPAIDLICATDGKGYDDSEDIYRVFSKDGEAVIKRTRVKGVKYYSCEPVGGNDPFGFSSNGQVAPILDGKPHSSRQWLEATYATDHPDAVVQIAELFDSDKCGDLVLFAAKGWDFGKDYKGGHGGASRLDMRVPMMIVGTGIKKGKLKLVRNVDLMPTLLELMGRREKVEGEIDGVSFAKALKR